MDKPTPNQVIEAFRASVDPYGENKNKKPSKRLMTILKLMFDSSKRLQEAKGTTWNLSFDEYLSLITERRMRRMEDELKAGTLRDFMNSNNGYVLTTKTRAHYLAKVYDVDSVEFVNRNRSLRNHRFHKGDTHSDYSKKMMSEKRTGKTHDDATKEKISKGNKGQIRTKATKKAIAEARTGTKHSEETKAKQREKMKAYHAARRAAKEAANA
ncbi:NUMOD3 domain-containing DNA-binding protein [Sinorhizobium chiapasense]